MASLRPPLAKIALGLSPGMRVGLYGGSFDPAHAGHLHVAETARKRLGLTRVIWLASPGNPLKSAHAPASLGARMAGARKLALGPSMRVSDIEDKLGSPYTIDTVRALKARYPAVRFVWIVGADGLAGLHAWRRWRQILEEIPLAVVARPGWIREALDSRAARVFRRARIDERSARALPGMAPPAWVWLTAPLHPASSTALRNSPHSPTALRAMAGGLPGPPTGASS